jgi:hypothetical protein
MARFSTRPRRCAAALLLALGIAVPAASDDVGPGFEFAPGPGAPMVEDPAYGTGYDRYEPTFYTGFAPRTHDPKRVHLHVGRGNQLRVTAVLADAVLRDYARDLLHRRRTYRTLIDRGRIALTQNSGFDAFERTLAQVEIERLVQEEGGLAPAELRERNVRLLERLNPGRVFRIEMPASEVARRWAAQVRPEDRREMTRKRQLELLNQMLPTRLWIAELDAGVSKELRALVRAAPAWEGAETRAAFEADFFALFERVSRGFYPRREGALVFVEFTAVYPIGTFNDYTEYRGRKIPLYPTPGRRALTTHQRTHTVDHIPTKAIYSYSPWIPYMHVGKALHNSFHTLWWRMQPETTSFLPASWQSVVDGSRNGKPHRYLWLLSRGPMSHGCTHVNTGHILELRQLLPSETELLYEVDTFLNKSYLYDVFDVDGDLEPEVIGVQYYIAYSLRNKRPHRLRAPSEKHAFYDWLYGGELRYDERGRGWFREVRDGRFIDRTAVNGARYEDISLYEADYEPEKFQFYRMVDIPFARELRKVSLQHPFDGIAPVDPVAN